jgi:exo-beta-1,3-glucanase (GH17 family)
MMKTIQTYAFIVSIILMATSCNTSRQKMNNSNITAAEILGNPDYLAISYGGYRKNTRDVQPTIEELKDDMKILSAMGIRIIRTYNVHLPQAENILAAISELKKENPSFEMYVMLGAWIDCLNAWTDKVVNHHVESPRNEIEIDKAVALANQYPDIVKVLAVGNEAMVKWAESYYVQPGIILNWVSYLQTLKRDNKLPKDLWITSSDDFASWGGGDTAYHNSDLEDLIRTVDYISMHTYPFHNTHYSPAFWEVNQTEALGKTQKELIEEAMIRARDFAVDQYHQVKKYMESLGVNKPIHIGETGWATISNGYYGRKGSHAADQYKQAKYYRLMRAWAKENKVSCFFFEAFDEPWKEAHNAKGSENHFGLITVDGKAKYALWEAVDKGVFEGLTRNGNPITKTFNGVSENLYISVLPPNVLELNPN